MENAALNLFENLNEYSEIKELINEGETENLYLECKSSLQPKLNQGMKLQLSKALSGFSNTEGGIIIWGVSTTKHDHGELDVLSQIEEVGNCDYFAKQIEITIPSLTIPSITKSLTKIIKKQKKDSRGIMITYIPKNLGDPIMSTDDKFYFRSGDEFIVLPYEMLKRLFASTESPDLHAIFDARLIIKKDDDTWEIPIIISNKSSATAEQVHVFVEVENTDDCDSISSKKFIDNSEINPGKKAYFKEFNQVIHKGINTIAGSLIVKMKTIKRPKRVFKIQIRIYANKMRAIVEKMSIYLSSGGVSVKKVGEDYLY